jgi:hypothetical protein
VNLLPVPHVAYRPAAFLLTLALLFTAGAQARSYHYLGELAGSPAQLQLKLEQDAVSGWLMQETSGKVTEFTGLRRASDDWLFLDLGEAGQLFGELSNGLADDGLVFEGTLLGTAGDAGPFRFEQVAQFVTSQLDQGRIETTSTYPFFLPLRLQGINNFLQPDLLAEQICFLAEGQYRASDGELFNAWTYDGTTEIAYVAPGLFSGLTTVSLFTGGAHPALEYWSYNLAYTGTSLRPFGLAELFDADVDAVALLNPLLLESLARQQAAWVLDGSVSSFTEEDLEVFTISPAGLEFVFAPYIVGPWVEGTFRVRIPLEDLAGSLRPDGPVRVISARSQE